jgi:hypothetical protein
MELMIPYHGTDDSICDILHEQAMMSMQTGKHQNMYNVNMSVSTAKDIFAKVWDEPVCELFVESGMPGFTGVCTVQESADSCSWCSGKSARPGIVDEQIVAQTAQWFSGLMQVIDSICIF